MKAVIEIVFWAFMWWAIFGFIAFVLMPRSVRVPETYRNAILLAVVSGLIMWLYIAFCAWRYWLKGE